MKNTDMAQESTDMLEELRQRINNITHTKTDISKSSGVDRVTLTLFLKKNGKLSLDNYVKLKKHIDSIYND